MSDGAEGVVEELRGLSDDPDLRAPQREIIDAAAAALEAQGRALTEKDAEVAEARARIQALEWEKDVAIIAARDAALSAIAASPEEGWHYSINFGPDGEANFANVYAPNDAFVGNLKTHHAATIVAGMNAAASATRQRDEALAALKASEERGAGLRKALEPFAREYGFWDHAPDDYSFGRVGLSITPGDLRRAKSALENGPSTLADANKKDPGTEQREAGV